MTTMNAFTPPEPMPLVHRICEVAADCWWVTRQDWAVDEFQQTMTRVVFIGRSQREASDWLARQEAGAA